MKRFVFFVGIVAVILLLPISVSWGMNTWDSVGANPTTLSMVETMKKMDISPYTYFVQENFPETTYVGMGTIFNQTSSGNGKIQNNVFVAFRDPAKALVWHAPGVDIYYFLHCNNVAWKAACDNVGGTVQTPVTDTVYLGPSTKSGGFPEWLWWLLAILIAIILLIIIYRLIRGAWSDAREERERRERAMQPAVPMMSVEQHQRILKDSVQESRRHGHAEAMKEISGTHIDTGNLAALSTERLIIVFMMIRTILEGRRKRASEEVASINNALNPATPQQSTS